MATIVANADAETEAAKRPAVDAVENEEDVKKARIEDKDGEQGDGETKEKEDEKEGEQKEGDDDGKGKEEEEEEEDEDSQSSFTEPYSDDEDDE